MEDLISFDENLVAPLVAEAQEMVLSEQNMEDLISFDDNLVAPLVAVAEDGGAVAGPPPIVCAPVNFGGQVYLIPRFTGEDEVTVDEFVEAVTLAQSLSQWNDKQTLAVARLRLGGVAAEHIRVNETTALVNWGKMEAALRSRFTPRVPRFALEQKFISCFQKRVETAAEFATRLQLLGIKLERAMKLENDNKDIPVGVIADRVFHQFLAGIRNELRRFVLLRSPRDLAGAIAAAEAEEAVIDSFSGGALSNDINVRAVEMAMANMSYNYS